MNFNHMSVHVSDVRKRFAAVGAALGSGDMKVKSGLVVKVRGALSAILGEVNDKQR